MNSYFNVYDYSSPYQYDSRSLQWCFHCPSSIKWVSSSFQTPPAPYNKQFLTAPSSPSPTYPPAMLEKIYTSLNIVQDIVVQSQERKKRILSSIWHVRSVLQEDMQLDSTSIDNLENSDVINITSVSESAYVDSNIEVADMAKSHLDSELPVLGVGDTIPQSIFSDVLSGASIDATELKFSPLSFSVKGQLDFDCKVFDRLRMRDISAEFPSPSAPIGSLPPVLSINDYKWVDTGQLRDSFDMRQYNQIKLLCVVEVLIECSDNLTSFCNSYKLLGISIENLFLYPFARAAISSVESYAIDQFMHVEANCKRNISVERYILETANNFSGNSRSYICPLSYSMARATILSLLIELSSSERVEPGLPLLLPFNFECKNGNFTRQINLDLVICHPTRILEWIDSLKGSMSLLPQQEQVEGIFLLVGKFEGSSDYDYDSWVVYVPNNEFLSSISPTDLKYWERYTGSDLVKKWRKHLDILLPMLTPIVTLYSIWVTYGAYIVAYCVDSKIIKATVLRDEMVVQEIKSNIVLRITKIQEFCNEYTPLEADFVLVVERTWLEVQPFSYSLAAFIIFIKFFIHTFDPGILNIRITDDIDLAMHTHSSIPATYYLISILWREQLGGLVMGEVGTDAFVNFDKMAKSSDLVFLLPEMVMFDIHKSNGPLSDVVKKCSLMFFEISEN
ncbi:putative protein isoform X1 [Capsicum galapagoense]